jgi:hypothetical protein
MSRSALIAANRHQLPDVRQVSFHIRLDVFGRARRLELRPSGKADISERPENGDEVDFSFAEIVWIVFQMHLADALAPKPSDLLDDIEAVISRVADIVVGEDGRRFRALHDADVVARRDRVFQAKGHASLLGRGRELAENVAHIVHLVGCLDCSVTEKRNQDHLEA